MPDPNAVIRIEGLEPLLRRFGTRELVRGPLVDALDASAKSIEYRMKFYPPPPRGAKMQFVSDRQRRGFFAKLRSGEIQVPYVRTGTLGKKITSVVDKGKLEARVGTKLSYAPYVVGKETQAPMHRGRWHTFESVAEEKRPEVEGYFREAVVRIAQNLAGER